MDLARSLPSAAMQPTPLPPGALLSRAEWRARGVSTGRLAGPSLVTVFRGFSTPAAQPASINTMCHVLQNEVIPGAVVSHSTAAAILGIAIPWWLDGEMGMLSSAAYLQGGERIVPSTLPAPPPQTEAAAADTLAELRMTRVESGLPLERSGIRYSPPSESTPLKEPPLLHCRLGPGPQRSAGPRTLIHRTTDRPSFSFGELTISHPYVVLLELAGTLEHDDLVVAVDSLVSRDPPLRGASLAKIRANADAFGAQWGAPALRRAVRDARANTDSPGETRTRLLLVGAGFPEPVVNHQVQDPDTHQKRYLDLAYPEAKIAVEYDGDYHRHTKQQWREDQARKDSLASEGWILRTLTGQDIKQPQRALSALRRTFLSAGFPAPAESNWAGSAGKALGRSLRPPTKGQPTKG